MNNFFTKNPLLIGVFGLIAVAYAGGHAMLGRHEGRVATGIVAESSGVIRAASDTIASRSGESLAPSIDRQGESGEGVWVHGRIADDERGFGGSLTFRAAGDEQSRVTRTQGDGFFEVLLGQAGPYAVTFEPEGIAGTPQSIALSTTIPDGEEHTLELGLPEGSIGGRVLSPDGEPVPDALLSLYLGPGGEEAPAGTPIATTTTDGSGTFSFTLLETGAYNVFARSRSGHQFDRGSAELSAEALQQTLDLHWAY